MAKSEPVAIFRPIFRPICRPMRRLMSQLMRRRDQGIRQERRDTA